MEKVIVSAAITGSIHTPTMSPYLPITPQQIADEAVRAYEVGAAVAHVHVRNPETGQPSSDLELFREVLTKVKSKCNMIVCLSTGGGVGMTVQQRGRTIPTFKPELASFNFGSMNFGLFRPVETIKEFKYPWEKPYLEGTEDFIFPNTFKTLQEFCRLFAENETKPELEIYDLGMIYNVAFMLEREKEHFKKPVILTDYPKSIKAFYMKQNDDGKTVRAMDVLFPGIGEIIGGSQREEDYDKLLSRIRELKLPEKDLWWYLDTRKFGTAPHSGFGLGFERMIQFITGMANIRDVIPFPRTPRNAEF